MRISSAYAVALLVGCGGATVEPDAGRDHRPEPFEPTAATLAYCEGRDGAAIEARITELLGELTLE
jgi:hypothetical protein